MSFYNTGNPVPSIDPRDLDDNAKHLDEFVNGTEPTYTDRLGVERKTLSAIESDADSELLRTELASASGASIVGASRVPPVSAEPATAEFFFATKKVSSWEYEYLITSKPDVNEPLTWDWFPALQGAANENSHAEIQLLGDAKTSGTIQLYNRTTFGCDEGAILAAPGFASGGTVVRLGDSSGSAVWEGYGGSLHVKCGNQRVIGVDFSRSRKCGYSSVLVEKSSYIGVKATAGYGLSLPKIDALAPMIISGDIANASSDSIGLLVTCTDSNFGAGDLAGSAVGAKFTGNNNTIGGLHLWGLYQKAGVPQSVPMIVGLWNEGQANTFVGTISDSPSLIDYALAASITNGGIGFANRGNGFQAKFVGCQVYIPDRTAFGETLPVAKIFGYQVNQSGTYVGCEVTDDTGSALVAGFGGRYQGTALTTSTIFGRQETRLGGEGQALFVKAPYMSRGMEFQATTIDPALQADAFGACNFSMAARPFFDIVTNFGGDKRTVSLPRLDFGTSSFRTSTVTPLLTGVPSGKYTYRDTTLFKILTWDGTQWRDAMGNITA